METGDLQQELAAASSYERWCEALARRFDAAGLFFGHGTDNSADEAYWLVWHLLGGGETRWTEPPDRGLVGKAVEIAARRVETRMPLAYLLGEAWFAGLPFDVDDRVLVPRSPLAELIERRFEPWCVLRPGDRVLDVGTGSGALAIATAYHCPGVFVDATETSVDALAVARRNVQRHGLDERVRVLEADLFPRERAVYRVIISNPPYVPARALESLPPEYRHEPAQALVGGADGLDPTRRLLAGAREWLEHDGALIVEVGESVDALEAAYPHMPFVWVELERGGGGIFVLAADELSRSGS